MVPASPSPVPEGLPPLGEVLDGKFRLLALLGVGGMGAVFAAEHLHLGHRVAVKILLPEYIGDRELAERFVREARATIAMSNRHVARVFDAGRLPDGLPYMTMELLDGNDVGQRIERAGAFSVTEAVDLVLEVCHALAEVHDRGVVHRDLKPSNLFLARQPDGSVTLKLLDFGISKTMAERGQALTSTRGLLGSPSYMSPEQLRASRDVDPRTDVWALGVVLFELVSGRVPFDGATIAELGAQVLMGEAPRLASVAPHVPPGLDAIVARCLVRDPAARIASVRELAGLLLPYASPRGLAAAASIGAVPPPSTAAMATSVRVEPPRRGGLVVAAVAVALAAAFAFAFVLRSARVPAPAPMPAVVSETPATPSAGATADAPSAVPAPPPPPASGTASAPAARPKRPVEPKPVAPETRPVPPKPTATKPSDRFE